MATCNVQTLLTRGKDFQRLSRRDRRIAICQLLCEELGGGPVTPTNLDIDNASVSGNIVLTWAQSSAPTTNEIWRSINGSAFSLLDTTAGANTTYTDTSTIAVNTYYTYKVRGLTGSPGAFSNAVSIARDLNYAFSAVTTLSFPDLVIHLGDFSFNNATNVTSVSCPVLRKIGGQLTGNDATALTSLVMTVLATIGIRINLGNTGLPSLSLPALTSIGTGAIFDPMNMSLNPSLGSTNFPLLVLQDNGAFWDLSQNALDAASINQFLNRGVVSGTTTDTYNLNGGTNAAPTGQGILDKATLILAGNTVNTN